MKKFVRLPPTKDRSLKAWSAIDEHIIKHIHEEDIACDRVAIYHDRYGYLTCNLSNSRPTTYTYLKSQSEAIHHNAISNGIESDLIKIKPVLDTPAIANLHLIKIPKSLDLFRLYLIKILETCEENSKVITGFMTRNFTKSMLTIAEEYFDSVSQSKAWKKSRLLILENPKKEKADHPKILNSIVYNSFEFKQYLGVFSANHIDYATQFLLEHLHIQASSQTFLDIGCGNGIIGKFLLDQKSWKEAVLMDDSILATASSQMNIEGHTNVQVLHDYQLNDFSDDQFDLIISNPPFHFEYEVDPSIAIALMSNTHRILSEKGRLIIVANRHLNYKNHLAKCYSSVETIKENDKFIIYQAIK